MKTYSPVEMIEKLVSFDTVSRHSNMALIDFVRDYLSGFGVESHLVPNEDGSKANLYATVGPNVTGGVVLSGHTDVVPVDGQPWDTDPFKIVEKDGKLFGRGTCDMKSFIAIALSKVPEMLSKDIAAPIHFAFSYDEEVGCAGAPPMIREMAEKVPQPRAAIIGEPTNMEIVNAHKGVNGFKTTVIGHEAHSSQVHRGVSAVMTAAKLINFLDCMMAENRARADASNGFEPPFSTLHVGQVNGGTALNIISRKCEFVWDVRNIPEDDPFAFVERFEQYANEELLPGMRAIAPECSITTERTSSAPAMRPEENGAAEELCKHLTGRNSVSVVPYATEAGQFQEVGYSTIVCGPGSIDQAHQPNEFIEKSQVTECEQFLGRLIDHLAR
ncbi:acetylornithine deacetylase [Aestuariispira insulae]|uniref:Acetylornithine deacetylase n=1 Tax=Aestuariispira insulae TaxID=1461337 RepID=A0A3D9HPE6_9PROT|nr:acetylornithine deacetylase [Aestuariispira insulae]RED50766.1 acetylornithine deacetylase [Aestuariispira insulae]